MRNIEEVILNSISSLPEESLERGEIPPYETERAKWRMLRVLLWELGIIHQVYYKDDYDTEKNREW